ncbi:questin oxidase family protein [Streptomyces sp. NPDC004752]
MPDFGILDDAYDRLHATGPEFEGWLSNHGPMAVDAMARLGHGDRVSSWLDGYARRLEARPGERWRINPSDWREYLGDPSRLGDWIALFEQAMREEPWREVLVRWWPRLVPGAVASATHGMIRTGHAVRSLREEVTRPRLDELAHALGYWAARWQTVPCHGPLGGASRWEEAMDGLPLLGALGGIRTRLWRLGQEVSWPAAVAPPSVEQVPDALRALTDAAVVRYRTWASGNPVMLVHAATAPRAAGLVLPELPKDQWQGTLNHAWAASAAICTVFRPTRTMPEPEPGPEGELTRSELSETAVRNGDEHVIKFVEVALESEARGVPGALEAGRTAVGLINAAG